MRFDFVTILHNTISMYFLSPFRSTPYSPSSVFLHLRSVYSWPTCLTTATIDLAFTRSSTWPPSFARGQTWDSTRSRRCSSHTSTSSFSPNKGTHSGRCVRARICPHVWACVSVRCYHVFRCNEILLLCRFKTQEVNRLRELCCAETESYLNYDDLMRVHFSQR